MNKYEKNDITGMYKCPYCNNEYENKKSLSNHARWHDVPKYKKYQDSYKKRMSGERKGKNNPNWKGENVSYKALHSWMRRNKPKPMFCEECLEEKPFEVANISGEYKRDVNDFKWICRSCHMKEDGRVVNLKEYYVPLSGLQDTR